jgi:hypothetical protein
MAEPWQCPACKTWIRPDVSEHKCPPDDGVTASLPAPAPTQPPATISVTTRPHGLWYGQGGSGGATTFTGSTITWVSNPATGGLLAAGCGGPGQAGDAATSASGGSDIVIHSHVHLDGKEIARSVQKEMLRHQQRNSGTWWQRGY